MPIDSQTHRLADNLDEHTPGISAIGFALADWSGDLHSILVPFPSTRFRNKRSEVEAAIENTARHVRKLIDQSAAVQAVTPALTPTRPCWKRYCPQVLGPRRDQRLAL
ncbi:MAG: hypothetical protein NXH88_05405 [Hyphomonas sp.]|jgi:hypothetical protein|nr:hypothetical protein [Hyphomonas sp.]